MKVLVTAFKPFNKMPNNYSMEVLKYISNVDKYILDVCYDECYKELTSNNELSSYDLIIALGEARSRKELMIEVVAKNISSCSIPDNNGQIKNNEKICSNGSDTLETLLCINKIPHEIKLSYDAGKFVCNNLYYHLFCNYQNRSLFIHIPNCNDDSREFIKYAKQIEEIIDEIKRIS